MTSRLLTALAAGVALTGALVAVSAAPALAQTYPSPTPSTTAPAGVTVTITYDAATNTLTITITGLAPGSTVTIVIVAGGAVTGASYPSGGDLVIRAADREGAGSLSQVTTAAAATAALPASHSFSGVADSTGVAHVAASLSAFGDLTAGQVAALQYTVSGTGASGVPYATSGVVGSAAASAGGAAVAVAAGALPRTGSSVDSAPLVASGLALLVVGGSCIVVARRRREDFVA